MARQLRIEYRGAVYHVISRGNQKNTIFFSDNDRIAFLKYCQGAHERYGALVHSYCLMNNHYHLLLETPRGNLSQIMHFINASYTIFINTKYSRTGHLLQGRFKAILIQADSYARELSRYIHLNPVRAAIVRDPMDYRWSSYREFIGRRASPPWLSTVLVLSFFGNEQGKAQSRYAAYVAEAIGRADLNPMSKVGACSILGSEEFIKVAKNMICINNVDKREVPAIRGLKEMADLAAIQEAVEQVMKTKNKLTRNMTILICRKNTQITLGELSAHFRISKSAVSKISGQMGLLLEADDVLKKAMSDASDRAIKRKVESVDATPIRS